jgi:hypothetical protein
MVLITAGFSQRGTGKIPVPPQKFYEKSAPGCNSVANALALNQFGETMAWL